MCIASRYRQAGISLIELVIFIVVVSIGVVGILSVMNVTTKASADPLLRKQALAIAESLLEEIELQAFTFCDPNDPQALTATSAAVGPGGCSSAAWSEDTLPAGPRVANAEGVARDAQNVSDYQKFSMTNPVRDVGGSTISGLSGYQVKVTISQIPFTDIASAVDTLKIDVAVTDPSGAALTLTGYRMRYAPNALP